MRIWLYSHLDDSPGNRLFTAEAESRGHEVVLTRPDDLNIVLGEDHASSLRPDLIFTRVGSSAPASAITKLACLEQRGHKVVNSTASLLNSRDKTLTYSLLSQADIPIPKTVVLGNVQVDSVLSHLPGPPWIVKQAFGTKGQGVCLVESHRSLRSVLEVLSQGSDSLLIQEFIEEAAGTDTRVVVLGGRAVVAARRVAQREGEFRSNVHLGGSASRVNITAEMRAISEAASNILGLKIAGVDLLSTRDGFKVVEVNGSSGLTVSTELPALVVDYLEGMML